MELLLVGLHLATLVVNAVGFVILYRIGRSAATRIVNGKREYLDEIERYEFTESSRSIRHVPPRGAGKWPA